VRGNPVATVRVVGNLVKNAINNTPSGRVLLGCRREEGACVICIADTGRGMDARTLSRVREAFEQGDDVQDGHGLGLHIVASLCARLGYHFDISSAEGRGTLARVRLARQG
jgi:signal transduction histidine kinase